MKICLPRNGDDSDLPVDVVLFTAVPGNNGNDLYSEEEQLSSSIFESGSRDYVGTALR